MTNWKSERERTVEEGQQQEHMITENKSSITEQNNSAPVQFFFHYFDSDMMKSCKSWG